MMASLRSVTVSSEEDNAAVEVMLFPLDTEMPNRLYLGDPKYCSRKEGQRYLLEIKSMAL